MCMDYREFYANTIIDAYLITCIDDILDFLGGLAIFSKIELA